jgi:hypothetical protein
MRSPPSRNHRVLWPYLSPGSSNRTGLLKLSGVVARALVPPPLEGSRNLSATFLSLT